MTSLTLNEQLFSVLNLRIPDPEKIQRVEELLDQGADINATNGCTPLQKAAMLGNLAMTRMLVRREAEINKANHMGQTALFDAVRNGHYNVALFLLRNGANPNIGRGDDIPLIRAVHHYSGNPRSLNLVRSLIRAGANTSTIPRAYLDNAEIAQLVVQSRRRVY